MRFFFRVSAPLGSLLIALAASVWASGAHFGFGALSAQVLFWLLALLVGLAAWALAAGAFCSQRFADLFIRTAVLTMALVVVCGLVLGAAHLVSPASYLIAEVLILSVVWLRWGRPARATSATNPPQVPRAMLGLWIAIAAFVMGMGISHSPFTAYDSLSDHLYFPARWLQDHRLSIIPTPFSDEAQAYQPGNGELWFLWLMLPFHGDFLARVGQIPFYLLSATTVYALARRLGAPPGQAMYAPTFLLITPTVVEQAIGANVDLIHATLFVTAIYLGIRAVDSNERRDWAIWGICVGLFIGTKFLALVYLPVLLAIPLVRGLRLRALWAVPGIAACGLPWYLRNWAVTGSPIYPATLKVAGYTIGQGAFSREAMARSFMHTTDARILLVSTIHAFGVPAFLVLVPAAVLVGLTIARRRAWWPAGFVLLGAGAVLPLCWFAVGDNTDSRFLLPAVVTLLSLLPLPFGPRQRPNAAIHAFYVVGILWILIGRDVQLPLPVPWYMEDWLSLRGLIGSSFLIPFVLLAGGGAGLGSLASRRNDARLRLVTMATATVVAGVTLAVGAETSCRPGRCDYVNVPPTLYRTSFLFGERWLTAHVHGANVAYTGLNLPYPLSGSDLTNVVSYVNIDRHTDWRFHDYARARASRAAIADPAALATSSGLLLPVAAGAGPFDAVRPRFERMVGNRDAWIANLAARRIEYLFISTLDQYEIEYVWHNSQRFPIEDEWARSDPSAFLLVYENPDVRIYQVATP